MRKVELALRPNPTSFFGLIQKTKQKGQGYIKKIMILIAIPKCGRVIYSSKIKILSHIF